MGERNFRQMLTSRQKAINSLVCVGLDPLPEKFPPHLKPEYQRVVKAGQIALWMQDIVHATAEFASMFKPQKAHWEAFEGGAEALQSVVRHIHNKYSDIPVFLDCKRGDIDRTQERYKVAHFEIDGVDGMNFSPYMGKSCMAGLVDKSNLGRALVGLCYTSNPSAREVQDIKLADGRSYWEFIADCVLRWATELGVVENAGLVMAAAFKPSKDSEEIFSRHLSWGREIVGGKLWFLIPGIGTQGGLVEETVKAAFVGWGSIAINSSSDIIFASSGEDFAEAVAQKAKELRDDIRKVTDLLTLNL